MTGRNEVRTWGAVRIWRAVRVCAAAQALAVSALVLLTAAAALAQDNTVQQPASITGPGQVPQSQSTPPAPVGDVFESGGAQTPPGDVFSSGVGSEYTDEFESSCEKSNANNPYAGMDPLKCYGVMAPTDSAGKCSLGNMQVLKQEGNTCYYCQPINPPAKGFIIPFDDLATADNQGFLCGVDQADPQCSAICTGTGTFKPPPGTTLLPNPMPPTQLFGAPPKQNCTSQRTDSFADVPNAAASLRYSLGFENGFKNCALAQLTVQNIAVAALAAKFQQVAALLTVLAAPSVVDGVLHPPGSSDNPNPYLRGTDEGGRLCTWMLKVAPAAVARCPAAAAPAATVPATGSLSSLTSGLSQAMGAVAGEAPKRFDCFLCTLAWLKNDAYTPPAGGGVAWTLAQIEQFLTVQYGEVVPQGPALPCWRQAAQAKGIPGSMSPVGIDAELKAAGDGAQGFIFILDPLSGSIGHVFGAKMNGPSSTGEVMYWDEQQQMPGQWWFTPGQWIAFYRTQ
jgi:hypothetical protein